MTGLYSDYLIGHPGFTFLVSLTFIKQCREGKHLASCLVNMFMVYKKRSSDGSNYKSAAVNYRMLALSELDGLKLS